MNERQARAITDVIGLLPLLLLPILVVGALAALLREAASLIGGAS